MAEQSGNSFVKIVILLLLLTAAGLGGTAYFFHGEYKQLANTEIKDTEKGVEAGLTISKSIRNYSNLINEKKIRNVNRDVMLKTEASLLALLQDQNRGGLVPTSFQVKYDIDRARRKETYDEHKIVLELFKVTKSQYEKILQLITNEYGEYATIRDLEIAHNGRVTEEYFNGDVFEDSVQWNVTILLVWNMNKRENT